MLMFSYLMQCIRSCLTVVMMVMLMVVLMVVKSDVFCVFVHNGYQQYYYRMSKTRRWLLGGP